MRLASFVAVLSLFAAPIAIAADSQAPTLDKAVHGPQRSAQFIARDSARHPAAELEFFGVKPGMSVVEIWPSGGYWTEILAPYLHDKGTYYAAIMPGIWGPRCRKWRIVFRPSWMATRRFTEM